MHLTAGFNRTDYPRRTSWVSGLAMPAFFE